MENQQTNDTLERSALIVATLSSFMGPFMMSAVNVALPAIQEEFHMNGVELSWIATAYLLAMSVALVPAGKLADIYGRKKVFSAGIAINTLGAFMAVYATSGSVLIAFRLVQGLGAAMYTATGVAILTSVYPPQKRGKAMGIYVSAVYIGLSVAPFAGGIMTHHFGWRSIFWLMLPLGIIALAGTFHFLKGEWFGDEGEKLDLLGCLLYGASIIGLVYGATQLPAMFGALLLLVGLVLMVVFFKHQLKARFPVFDVTLFATNKRFTYSSLAALLNYSTTFAVTFLMSLYLQYIKGLPPQTAGSILMVQPIVMATLSPFAGKLSDRIEARLLATSGMALTAIGVFIFSRIDQGTSIYIIMANLVLIGIGFAFFSSPNMNTIMGAVEKRYYGLASGVVATMRLLGQMFSMAMATVVLAIYIGQEVITPENYHLLLKTMQIVFSISALLCVAGIYFSWFRGNQVGQPEAGVKG